MPEKTKVKLNLKNLVMLPCYFDYIFMHLRQKVRLRPDLGSTFLSTLGPNPARTRARPEKPGPTYNSDVNYLHAYVLLKLGSENRVIFMTIYSKLPKQNCK